jgi:hypothetical protein
MGRAAEVVGGVTPVGCGQESVCDLCYVVKKEEKTLHLVGRLVEEKGFVAIANLFLLNKPPRPQPWLWLEVDTVVASGKGGLKMLAFSGLW